MISKKLITPLVVVCAFISAETFANESEHDVSFSASAFSHYLWRGFDLNDGNFAIQGAVNYENTSGLYAGAWASQYDFGGGDDGLEIDVYAGYVMALNNELSLDFSITNYQYTGDTDSSTEFKVGASFNIATINLHRDVDLGTTYIELNLQHEINQDFSLFGHFGINDDGDDAYNDYGVTLSYNKIENLELVVGVSGHEFDVDGADTQVFAGATYHF
ncbi:MAG: hypothetical protein ACI9O6_001222 [Glaciecola sp.]|jgi:uncharacterized protein (TIGR02001 family)